MKYSETHFIHLKPNTTHLWSINFVVDGNMYTKYHNLLSEDEKLRASKFRFYKDKRCYVVTKGILRLLSGFYLNKVPKSISFEYKTYGKPEFKHQTDLNFNVSHSGDMAVIAFVYDHAIGVDIEKIKNDFDTLEIASNFFSKKEISALQKIAHAKQHIAFYRCWTRKEALIKAKGNGLSFPLDQFSMTLDSDLEAELLETKWDLTEKNNWQLLSFIPNQGYIAALIVGSIVNNVDYFNWDHNLV
ncbi:4'-phosphopantetheinyl transferase family protein [Winogradskyella sp. PG-2]|uniref:4'-phosphopantetheinyl transferase family protein n=1 Tax=Winogradskyella sp. PG-2 TaxID=754409 RepID=UPI0004586EC9|nr:4'-phosphopantetheinyl transferase superfamily protein [Winogradskyella sp. PG-2]BAO74624.1 4'-phosphopantetheinyl transferase [Winogradskyella sp. PG-2]